MRVDISQIIGNKGAFEKFSLSEEIVDVNSYPDVVRFLDPVKAEGKITNTEGIFEVEGTVTTRVEMLCGRCLSPVEIGVNFILNVKFKSTGNLDDEMQKFSGNEIDLDEVIASGIRLSLPMKVVCREDCKGLCPICGKNLNEGSCGCDTTTIDPRFQELRSLFKLDEEV